MRFSARTTWLHVLRVLAPLLVQAGQLQQHFVGVWNRSEDRRLVMGARTREMIVQQAIDLLGLRPGLVPASVRRQLAAAGLDEPIIHRVLRDIQKPDDWPHAWQREGLRQARLGHYDRAFVSFYLGQRPILEQTAQKIELYDQACWAYAQAAQTSHVTAHTVAISCDQQIALLVDEPRRGSRESPVVLMYPGITSTKEELQLWSDYFSKRGWRCVRMDTPGYGKTTGIVDFNTLQNPLYVLDYLHDELDLVPSKVFLFGISFGGFLSMHAAALAPHRFDGLMTVSAPFSPHTWMHHMADTQKQALRLVTGSVDDNELFLRMRSVDLATRAERLANVRMLALHGTRDWQVPPSELERLYDAITGELHESAQVVCRRVPGATHGLLAEIPYVCAQFLEWSQ